jgi:hypothetical protein
MQKARGDAGDRLAPVRVARIAIGEDCDRERELPFLQARNLMDEASSLGG